MRKGIQGRGAAWACSGWSVGKGVGVHVCVDAKIAPHPPPLLTPIFSPHPAPPLLLPPPAHLHTPPPPLPTCILPRDPVELLPQEGHHVVCRGGLQQALDKLKVDRGGVVQGVLGGGRHHVRAPPRANGKTPRHIVQQHHPTACTQQHTATHSTHRWCVGVNSSRLALEGGAGRQESRSRQVWEGGAGRKESRSRREDKVSGSAGRGRGGQKSTGGGGASLSTQRP